MDRLEELSTAFLEAKILLAASELRLFDLLRGPGATAAEAARERGGTERGVRILLDALVAMEVIGKDGDRYRNDPGLEGELVSDAPSQYPWILRHRNRLFRGWARLEETIRGDLSVAREARRQGQLDPEVNEVFIRAMYAVSHRGVPALVDRLPLEGARRVADLGAGPGAYLAEMARRSSAAELYLVDLPTTLAVARRLLEKEEAARRIRFVEWDLYGDEPPAALPPLDLALLSHVVHGEGPEANRVLFGRIARVLAPGGLLVVHERIVDGSRTSPRDAAVFAVNMLAMTEAGDVYTEDEVHAFGRAAGLVPEAGERLNPRSYLVRLRRPA